MSATGWIGVSRSAPMVGVLVSDVWTGTRGHLMGGNQVVPKKALGFTTPRLIFCTTPCRGLCLLFRTECFRRQPRRKWCFRLLTLADDCSSSFAPASGNQPPLRTIPPSSIEGSIVSVSVALQRHQSLFRPLGFSNLKVETSRLPFLLQPSGWKQLDAD